MTQWDASGLLRGLAEVPARVNMGARLGLSDWGEYILGEAVDLTPIERGDLAGSGKVVQSIDGLTVGVGFGSGSSASYAVEQHENLAFHHDEGKQAKYLEGPYQASVETGRALLGRAIRGELRK